MDSLASWDNAVYAMPSGPFLQSLARCVGNSPEEGAASRWILTQVIQWANVKGEVYSPIHAYDTIVETVEALNTVWPAFHKIEDGLRLEFTFEGPSVLPDLARFIFERIPAVMKEVEQGYYLKESMSTTVGRALVIAERTHDLVALFTVGLKPNGSKDPYALRRSAKHFLWCVLPYLPVRKEKSWL